MTQRRIPPLAVLSIAGLLLAALVGVLVLVLQDEPAPVGNGAVSVVSRTGNDGASPPVLPTGDASRAPVARPTPAPVQGLAAPVQRIGAPLLVLRVSDADSGAPVTAFDVTILPFDSEPPLQRMARAEVAPIPYRNAAGIFRADCPSGRWDVIVRAPGYLPGILPDQTIPPLTTAPIPLTLSHGPSITGLVYDEARTPLVDVPVFLHVTRLFGEAAPPQQGVARTGGDGRFRFSPLPAGEYSLALLEPENRVDRLPSVIVNQGTTDVSLYLAPRHQLVVSVQDSYGRPVRDADVAVRSSAKFATARTAESGQAVLRHLLDGEYTLKVIREGYEPLEETLPLRGGHGEQVRWYTLREAGSG